MQFSTSSFYGIIAFCAAKYTRKSKRINAHKSQPRREIPAPKRGLITDFLMKTVKFNQENTSGLDGGKRMVVELEGVFRGMIT